MRMTRKKQDNGGRFRSRNLTSERFGTTKRVLSVPTQSGVERWCETPSTPLTSFIRLIQIILSLVVYVVLNNNITQKNFEALRGDYWILNAAQQH